MEGQSTKPQNQQFPSYAQAPAPAPAYGHIPPQQQQQQQPQPQQQQHQQQPQYNPAYQGQQPLPPQYVAQPPGRQVYAQRPQPQQQQQGYPQQMGYNQPLVQGQMQPQAQQYAQYQAQPQPQPQPQQQRVIIISGQQQMPRTQPQRQPYTGGARPMHEDLFCLTLLTCLCCCWPLGLVAICKASESNNAFARGDYAMATEYNRQARRWMKWSVITYIVLLIIVIASSVAQ